MAKRRTSKNAANPVIIVSVIGLIGTITTAILSSPVLVAQFQNASSQTLAAPIPTFTVPAPTYTNLQSSPISTPTIDLNQPLGIYKTGPETLLETINSTHPLDEILKSELHLTYDSDFDSLDPVLLPYDDFQQTMININPGNNPLESLNEIVKWEQNNQINYWDQISSKVKLILTLNNIQKGDGLDIKIEKDASVRITKYVPINAHVNAVVHRTGGLIIPVTGGGANYHFSSVMIESLNWSNTVFYTTLTEYDFIILEPGEIGTFELLLQCEKPGIYTIAITVNSYYAGEINNIEVHSPKPIVCPESLTIWKYKELSDEAIQYKWKSLGDYILQDGQYSQLQNP